MTLRDDLGRPGIAAALAAAALFGASIPVAKVLLATVSPWLMAGLLYLGSGLGLAVFRALRGRERVRLEPGEWRWLVGAILSGGVAAPVLLMYGLKNMPASGASLLLNAEGVFTVLIAWFVFHENFDRRIALGMLAIVFGAVIVSWPAEARFGEIWPALAVAAACLGWALDNNLTRRVSSSDATWIASVKGTVAGSMNLVLALLDGAHFPALAMLSGALLIGALSYGASLALFVRALRHLGTARTGAYFSIAPFFGAGIAVLFLNDPLTARLLLAGSLMGLGVWLHLTEQHDHVHVHTFMEHVHEHEHDLHHQHSHDAPVAAGVRHSHRHRHEPMTHTHPHFPDTHHRHDHGRSLKSRGAAVVTFL